MRRYVSSYREVRNREAGIIVEKAYNGRRCNSNAPNMLLPLAILLLFVISINAIAATAYQKNQILKYLDSSAMKQDQNIFDGKRFNRNVPFQESTKYYNDYLKNLSLAVSYWNKLSREDRASVEMSGVRGKLRITIAWAKAMQRDIKLLQTQAATIHPATPPSASGLSANAAHQRQKVLEYLDSPLMRQDTTTFDGKRFNRAVSFDQSAKYYDNFVRNLNLAVGYWNRVPTSETGLAAMRDVRDRLSSAINWAKAMKRDYDSFQQENTRAQAERKQLVSVQRAAAVKEKTAHIQLCNQLYEMAIKPHRSELPALVRFMLTGSAHLMKDHQDEYIVTLRDVRGVCHSLDMAVINASQCPFEEALAYDFGGRELTRPANICKTAEQGDELVARAAGSHQAFSNKLRASRIQTPEQFRKRNGWITKGGDMARAAEGPVEYKKLLYYSGNDAVTNPVAAKLERLRLEVEQTASQWQLPKSTGSNYSVDLARRKIRRWHPDAEVIDVFLSRNSFRVVKDKFHYPEHRTMPGYILLRLQGEPYCQLRPFELSEDYAGEGHYESPGTVNIGYVRFQTCP